MEQTELLESLKFISKILGPTPPKCCTCEGCREEWKLALNEANSAIKKYGEQNAG